MAAEPTSPAGTATSISPFIPSLEQARGLAGYVTSLYRERLTRWYAGTFRGDELARVRLREGRRDPYPIYERMRAAGPMLPTHVGDWCTTSHRLSTTVLRSRRYGVAEEGGGPGHSGARDEFDLSMLELNPPDHTRLRRLALPAFSPRMMATYADMIESRVHTLIDQAEARPDGRFDLIGDFAGPLPVGVISEMLGVDDADADALQHYGAEVASALDGVSSLRHGRAVIASMVALRTQLDDLFVLRSREPRDDLISALVAERESGGISTEELGPLCSLLLVAGFETTVNLLGNAVIGLMAHREQWESLVADPSLAAGAVEETLRWTPPVQQTARVSFDDNEIGGVTVRRGQWVVILLGATGRDPEIYPDPSRFDITRSPAVEHLAFSSGIHYCIGAPLARLEATVALRVLATRLPRLRQAGPVVNRRSTTIRGPKLLPVAVA